MPREDAKKRRVIAIQLDGADPFLIRRWMAEGFLPAFSSLHRSGTARVLRSSIDFSAPGTYGEFRCGLSPIRHGTGFDHRQFKSGTYTVRKRYSQESMGTPFWRYFPSGTRSILFDVPNTFVSRRDSEVHVVGYGEEGLSGVAGSHPRGLFRYLNRTFGPHPLHGWYHRSLRDVDDLRQIRDCLFEGIWRRERAINYLLGRYPWDFALVSFSESHFAGHYFWHLTDPGHPHYNPAITAEVGDTVRETYELLDRAVGRIVREHPDAYICVFSTTGMGPNYSGRYVMPEILRRLGYAGERALPSQASHALSILPTQRWGYDAVTRMEERFGVPLITAIKRLVPMRAWDWGSRRLTYAGNDWEKWRAFCLPGDFAGTVRINLIGREPKGRVPRGEFIPMCRKIAASLTKLLNGDTGKPAVDEVIFTPELAGGSVDYDFPDLIVRWKRDAPIRSLISDEIGTVPITIDDKHTGFHTADTLFIISGPGIGEGRELTDGRLVDVGPTLVNLLGGSCPDTLDGHVMEDIMR